MTTPTIKIDPPPNMTVEEFQKMFASSLAGGRIKPAVRKLYKSNDWKDLREQLKTPQQAIRKLKLELSELRTQTIKDTITSIERKEE